MITPLGWLERVPTYKDQIEQLRTRDLGTHGFLGLPGPDDGRHRASTARTSCRSGRTRRATSRSAARSCGASTASTARSSRSRRRSSRRRRRSTASTGGRCRSPTATRSASPRRPTRCARRSWRWSPIPARARRQDPGNPTTATSFPFHELFSPPAEVEVVDVECRTAARGCVDCKKHLIGNLNAALEPFRAEARGAASPRPSDVVRDVLHAGDAARARGRRGDDGEGARRREALAGAVMADETTASGASPRRDRGLQRAARPAAAPDPRSTRSRSPTSRSPRSPSSTRRTSTRCRSSTSTSPPSTSPWRPSSSTSSRRCSCRGRRASRRVDPRADLAQRLLEYEKFKRSAETLHAIDTLRGGPVAAAGDRDPAAPRAPRRRLEVSLFDLIETFRSVTEQYRLAHPPALAIHHLRFSVARQDDRAPRAAGRRAGRCRCSSSSGRCATAPRR